LSYFFSKILVELPLNFVQALVAYLVHYWAIGFGGNFILMVLVNFGLSVASSSVAVLLGCAVTDVKTVTEFLSPIFVPQLLFAGFFIRIDQIPVWLRWAQWLCSLKYSLNLLILLEFSDCDTEVPADGGPSASELCADLIEGNEVEGDLFFRDILVLIGLIVFFRLVALYILVNRAKSIY